MYSLQFCHAYSEVMCVYAAETTGKWRPNVRTNETKLCHLSGTSSRKVDPIACLCFLAQIRHHPCSLRARSPVNAAKRAVDFGIGCGAEWKSVVHFSVVCRFLFSLSGQRATLNTEVARRPGERCDGRCERCGRRCDTWPCTGHEASLAGPPATEPLGVSAP